MTVWERACFFIVFGVQIGEGILLALLWKMHLPTRKPGIE